MKVAFVCVHNSCRSQMAEAIAKYFYPKDIEWYSAGTQLKNSINSQAVEIVKQLYGVDMTVSQKPKLLSDLPQVDIVVTMGCNVECPTLPCKYREDWGLEDPTGRDTQVFVDTCRKIETKLHRLVQSIKTTENNKNN